MKAPPRLIDDPAVAPGLREDLERTRRAGPAYDVAVGLAGFQAALGAGAGAGAAGATATTTTTTSTSATGTGATSAAVQTAKVAGVLSVKTVVATMVATAAVATAIAWPSAKPAPARTPSGRAPAVATHATAPATAPAPVPAPAPEIPAATAAPVDAAEVPAAIEAAPTPASAVSARAGEKRSAARSADADSRREIAQLARIKAMVDVDPARAYRLAQQGDREFARGMLRQERDALAIVALARSERTAEAKQHLRAFVARYPNSPAREHLTQLLGAEHE